MSSHLSVISSTVSSSRRNSHAGCLWQLDTMMSRSMCRYTHDVPKVTIIHLAFLKAEEAAAKEVLALRRNSSGDFLVNEPWW